MERRNKSTRGGCPTRALACWRALYVGPLRSAPNEDGMQVEVKAAGRGGVVIRIVILFIVEGEDERGMNRI